MKRLIACVSLVAAATTAAVPSTATTKPAPKAPVKAATTPGKAPKTVAKAPPKCRVAPADEYFGKLKMSILGIRNTIKDQGLKVDVDPTKAPSTSNAIALTEDAIHDWQHKYPCDTWLPGTLLGLERFYLKIHTDDGVKHVHATFAWLRHDYPRSNVVQVARREDGQATVAPASPSVASGLSSADAAASPMPSSQPAVAPVLMNGQAPATPYPGTAPQSVINAISSPSPTPTPRR
ncbi:MAG: hypothetical protein M3N49_10195 [Candidatus Eremiobacteraeota bacterium]|nr:hypothetical protein [Candidatus Eremiobacteraeota bacterium]